MEPSIWRKPWAEILCLTDHPACCALQPHPRAKAASSPPSSSRKASSLLTPHSSILRLASVSVSLSQAWVCICLYTLLCKSVQHHPARRKDRTVRNGFTSKEQNPTPPPPPPTSLWLSKGGQPPLTAHMPREQVNAGNCAFGSQHFLHFLVFWQEAVLWG